MPAWPFHGIMRYPPCELGWRERPPWVCIVQFWYPEAGHLIHNTSRHQRLCIITNYISTHYHSSPPAPSTHAVWGVLCCDVSEVCATWQEVLLGNIHPQGVTHTHTLSCKLSSLAYTGGLLLLSIHGFMNPIISWQIVFGLPVQHSSFYDFNIHFKLGRKSENKI